MRLLRELPDERTGRMLVDALSDVGIESELKDAANGVTVWVIDETQLSRAKELVASWFDGESEAFQRTAARGRGARELRERAEQRRRQQLEAAARKFEAITKPRPTPLTWGLIAMCVGLFLVQWLQGTRQQMFAALSMTDPREPVHVTLITLLGVRFEWLGLPWREPWRMLTPVLVHADGLHILFNMLWLRDLGRVVEGRHGTRFMAMFVVITGVLSNIAEYELGRHDVFVGMSGVVYALLGLVLVRGRLHPQLGYAASRFTVQLMLIWLLVGFIGELRFPNLCHAAGLLVGGAWGYLSVRFSAR